MGPNGSQKIRCYSKLTRSWITCMGELTERMCPQKHSPESPHWGGEIQILPTHIVLLGQDFHEIQMLTNANKSHTGLMIMIHSTRYCLWHCWFVYIQTHAPLKVVGRTTVIVQPNPVFLFVFWFILGQNLCTRHKDRRNAILYLAECHRFPWAVPNYIPRLAKPSLEVQISLASPICPD